LVSQTSGRWCLPAYRTADALIKADPTRTYTETYLHRAVALNGLKDLDGALTSVKEALKLDPQHKRLREEYVLGRILEAKGDAAGGPRAQGSISLTGTGSGRRRLGPGTFWRTWTNKPGTSGVDPDLEVLWPRRRRERLHWLPSQYRLFPSAAGDDGLDGALLPTLPVHKFPCMRSIFKVTKCDLKKRIASVFADKVSRDTEGTVRRPTVSKQRNKGRMSLPVPVVTWTMGLFACILLRSVTERRT
jgi:hypothetical protein